MSMSDIPCVSSIQSDEETLWDTIVREVNEEHTKLCKYELEEVNEKSFMSMYRKNPALCYLKKNIYPVLLPVLKHTFQQILLEGVLINNRTKFHPLDHVAYLLWNMNPNPPELKPNPSELKPNSSELKPDPYELEPNPPELKPNSHHRPSCERLPQSINNSKETVGSQIKTNLEQIKINSIEKLTKESKTINGALKQSPQFRPRTILYDIPFVRNTIHAAGVDGESIFPPRRPVYQSSWLWSIDKAAEVIQKYARGMGVRRRKEVEELRQFWKMLEKKEKKMKRCDVQKED